MNKLMEELNCMGKGMLVENAQQTLDTLIKAVRETGKKGSMTIQIDCGLLDKDGTVIELSGSVKDKIPRHTMPKLIRYTDDKGRTYVNDPDQVEFNFSNAKAAQAAQETKSNN
jgi:hypothetical protein